MSDDEDNDLEEDVETEEAVSVDRGKELDTQEEQKKMASDSAAMEKRSLMNAALKEEMKIKAVDGEANGNEVADDEEKEEEEVRKEDNETEEDKKEEGDEEGKTREFCGSQGPGYKREKFHENEVLMEEEIEVDGEEDVLVTNETCAKKMIRLEDNIVRWSSVKNHNGMISYESNARFVKWEDGSLQLLIGNEVLNISVGKGTLRSRQNGSRTKSSKGKRHDTNKSD